MKSFSDLLDLHQRLDELFLDHQRALMRLDPDRAESLLDHYEADLLAHIRDEEDSMLPAGSTGAIFTGLTTYPPRLSR